MYVFLLSRNLCEPISSFSRPCPAVPTSSSVGLCSLPKSNDANSRLLRGGRGAPQLASCIELKSRSGTSLLPGCNPSVLDNRSRLSPGAWLTFQGFKSLTRRNLRRSVPLVPHNSWSDSGCRNVRSKLLRHSCSPVALHHPR